MALFLGVDGGGTGCRAAVADAEGRVLGSGQAGPANIASDPEGARANILAATQAALAAANLAETEIAGLQAGLGLAGANASRTVDRLTSALPFARARIVTDAVTAVKGALGAEDGVVAALGTGSVFAAQRGGVVRQIGGWGLVLGDEASGAWIGRALCSAALRAVDGFRAMTPLLAELAEENGGPHGLVSFSLAARPADFATLAPRVVRSGDEAALAIMAAAEGEVSAAVELLRGADPLPVVFLGGLGPVFSDRLGGRWPIRQALGTSLDGALRLARE
jgi:glucosamine kinase